MINDQSEFWEQAEGADQWPPVSGGPDLGEVVRPKFGSTEYWTKWLWGDGVSVMTSGSRCH